MTGSKIVGTMTDRSDTKLRRRLRVRGLTLRGFAELTGHAVTTVAYWGRERPGQARVAPVPPWVWLLLDAWDRHPVLLASAMTRLLRVAVLEEQDRAR